MYWQMLMQLLLDFNNGLIFQWMSIQQINKTINAQETATAAVSYPITVNANGLRFPGSRNVHITISTIEPTHSGCKLSAKCTKTSGSTDWEQCFLLFISWI